MDQCFIRLILLFSNFVLIAAGDSIPLSVIPAIVIGSIIVIVIISVIVCVCCGWVGSARTGIPRRDGSFMAGQTTVTPVVDPHGYPHGYPHDQVICLQDQPWYSQDQSCYSQDQPCYSQVQPWYSQDQSCYSQDPGSFAAPTCMSTDYSPCDTVTDQGCTSSCD